jgi:hypothetical protein
MSIWTDIFGKPKARHVHDWTKWNDHASLQRTDVRDKSVDIVGWVQMRECTECGLKEYNKTSIFDMRPK